MAAAPRPRRAGAAPLLAAAALLAALVLPAAGLLTPAQSATWASYLRAEAAARPGGAAAASPLAAVFSSHGYSTPLDAVKSSNVYTGGNARLRRVVNDLLGGAAVKIVAIGGPATNGSDASQPGRNDYFAQYVNYLASAFPGATIKPVRAPAGLAPSAVVAGCLSRYLPDDADLVLLEMTANDGAVMDSSIVNPTQPKAYEILARRILEGSRKPALVLTQTMPPGMGNASRPFYITPESPQYAAISGYYNIPYVSMRNALWPGGRLTARGTMSTDAVDAADGSTPLDAGHSAIADSLVFLTQSTARDLQLLPLGAWDTSSADADVPSKPMFGGVADGADGTLRAAACSWGRNASVTATGGCPSSMGEMCGLDYSSWEAARKSYRDNVKEVFDSDGANKNAALIGGIVGGVLGGLALIAAGAAACIVRHKRRAAAEEAAYAQKQQQRPGSALPITASAGGAPAVPYKSYA
ncbi:MAG: hypothetical protein J3K34DRAFT_522045 [Monoraphidium minutum]|nr:MAG: hypothetical protein J3K34DRAFT_522045 [Monoraphidium minutum]